ncbi:MAG: sialate O-acetylesterase [Candidatus Hydrogenedentes bacterium]|nr:sialate O-acetylesterase [Candidatus Hydrogenedentota bacterium]
MRHTLASCVVLLCLGMLCSSAHALSVTKGLAPYQVVQCGNDGKASIDLAGASVAAGKVQARVVGVQKEIIPWTDLGKAAGGAWQGALPAVPAGGPYRVEVRLVDDSGKTLEETAVSEAMVGDVWILAGQSNMQGVGNRVNVESPHPQVHTFAMNYEWRLAQEPLHTLAESPDPVHGTFPSDAERQKAIAGWRDGAKGAGLGIAFAKEMLTRTGRPVGLIASAHGGTSMEQWDPAQKDKAGASLYGSMCKQVQAAGGKVKGVLWYQGESDANEKVQPVYREKMKQLVGAMRADLGVADLPFYYVQISRFAGKNVEMFPAWGKIQSDELALEGELGRCGLVSAIDLDMDDGIHIGTPGLKTLGYRLACLAEKDLFGGKVLRGPRLEKIEPIAGTPHGQQLRVKFASVNGGLKAAGRVSGFSISGGPDAANASCIFKQEVSTDDPTVIILWVESVPENAQLWYGRGLDPYCNVVDQANMALPVFGPVAIPK